MNELYINRDCIYYDWGDTAPREYGAFCKLKKCCIENANCAECNGMFMKPKYKINQDVDYVIQSENGGNMGGYGTIKKLFLKTTIIYMRYLQVLIIILCQCTLLY